jgi:hypothetical protein
MSGAQYRVVRKIGTIAVVPGGFATIDLPRSYDLESLFMRINGTVNVATNAATSVRAEAPCQVVSRVELTSDGKNNLASCPFWALSFGKFDRLMPINGGGVATPPSGVAIASYNVEAIGVVDQAFVDGARPKDSNYRTSGLQLFQLRLTFGLPSDMFVAGTAVVSYTNMNVDVFTAEMVELPDPADKTFTNPIALRKVSYQEIALPASNANQELRLPAGNLIKSVLIRTEGAVTAGEPGVGVLNNVQIAAGTDVRLNLAAANVRRKNITDYGNLLPGYYVHDFPAKGFASKSLTECWDVTQQNEPKAILDVTGGASVKMQVVTTEFILAVAK